MYQSEKHTATSAAAPGSPLSPYHGAALPYRGRASGQQSNLNPRSWSRKTWAIVAGVVVVIIIAAVVGAVLGVRANAYPNYSQINYRLQDTCK